MKTRQQIISNAVNLKAEIDQLFIDADYWNKNVRKASEKDIDPDPDGQMCKTWHALDDMLKREEKLGYYKPVNR